MKKLILFSILTLVSQELYAAKVRSNRKIKRLRPAKERVTNGLRLGLNYGISSDINIKVSTLNGVKTNQNYQFKQKLGASLGYAYIESLAPGFLFDASFSSFEPESNGKEFNSLRLSGNLTFGITEYAHLQAGALFHQYLNVDIGIIEDLDPGFGYQLGIGVTPLKNMFVNLNYFRVSNKDQATGAELEIETNGLELVLGYQF